MRRPYALYCALMIVIAAAASAVAYPRLPERVPVHWDLSGEPDRFGSRLEGVWLIPAVMVAVWIVMRLLPRIDPRRDNYAKMESR